MMSLQKLLLENPVAFYELVEKCRNPKQQMFGNTQSVVKALALMYF